MSEQKSTKKIIILKKKNVTVLQQPIIASQNRKIADPKLFESSDPQLWETVYNEIMDKKYAKGTRNYSTKMQCAKWSGQGEAPIYVIPRQRGGPSYKKHKLENGDPDNIHYALISKGFGMQDLSSFSLGPIIGEGLCLVNAAFSKLICIMHVEGGGQFDPSYKNFWKRSKPIRKINLVSETHMIVDSILCNIKEWLFVNEHLWLEEWDKWRKAIALCSLGNFHWADDSPTIGYKYKDRYLDFVEWKKECYIKPSYELLPHVPAFQYLQKVHQEGRALGLVHPKGIDEEIIPILTPQHIVELFKHPVEMVCQPYVVAGRLLGAVYD